MAEPAQQRATYEDLLRAPENMVAEIIDGAVDPGLGGPLWAAVGRRET